MSELLRADEVITNFRLRLGEPRETQLSLQNMSSEEGEEN